MHKNYNIITLLLIFLFSLSLKASIYKEYSLYEAKEEKNQFMSGSFDEIIRFNKILLTSHSFDDTTSKSLDSILKKIQDNTSQSNKVLISIIGHASQNLQSDKEALEESKKNALVIKKYFIDKGINEDTLFLEYRGAKDSLYSTATQASRDMSQRVMISLYINLPRDLDKDGVDRDHDKCPDTLPGMQVDIHGCKLKTIVILLQGDKALSSVIVKNKAGNTTIDQPNQLVSIQSQKQAPSAPKEINQEDLTNLLANTLEETQRKKLSYTLYFQENMLAETSTGSFEDMLEQLKLRENPYIQVVGHTDTVGTVQKNDIVSAARANTIAKMIKDEKIQYLKIDIQSYSESNLAVPTKDNVFEALNRRVEVFID